MSYMKLQRDVLPLAKIFYIGHIKNLGYGKKSAIDLKSVVPYI